MIHVEMRHSHFYVYRELLTEAIGTFMAAKFGDTSQTHFLIDRDPDQFNLILQYLRSGRTALPKNLNQQQNKSFWDELRYWGLKSNMSTEQTLAVDCSSDKHFFCNESVHNDQSDWLNSPHTLEIQMDDNQDIWSVNGSKEKNWNFKNQTNSLWNGLCSDNLIP